jgi:hypothetical protein
MPDALFRAGPLDLGWIMLGLLWALVNLGALLLSLLWTALLSSQMQPYIGIANTLIVADLLWFMSPRRYTARSFAIGMLLAYALLHTETRGALTLWNV